MAAEAEQASVIRVAIAQVGSSLDAAENRGTVASVAAEAAGLKPDLLVLPEATMHDFGRPGLDLGAVAEPLDGPFVHALGLAAATAGCVVVAGMFELPSAGARRPYNTVVAVAPDGRLVARYRKLHLYDAFAYRESDRLTAGEDRPPVFEVSGLRIGVLTCYDLRFPEVGRLLADDGADVLVVPAAWVRGDRKVEHWRALLTARAIENTVYVIGAAQPAPRYCGHSLAIDPNGVVIVEGGADRELVHVVLDTAVVRDARRANPSLENRRFTVVRR